MNFPRGNMSSKFIHCLSSIAWLSLSEFCLQDEKSDHFAIFELSVSMLGEKIHANKFFIQNQQKKKRK